MFRIIVRADYGLFTRPECKVERVTYPVPTPSALEGMLKSVYWKPAIRYVIDKIVVFNRIRYASVRRNEVKNKISYAAVRAQMYGDNADSCLYTGESISQRASLLLKDLMYGVEFHFEQTGICSEQEDENEGKHAGIIRRRLERGQCFRPPCMGCREFPVKALSLVDSFADYNVDKELQGDVDLGVMLYGLRFHDKEQLKGEWKTEYFSDNADARFYHPHMVNGVIDVKKYAEDTL